MPLVMLLLFSVLDGISLTAIMSALYRLLSSRPILAPYSGPDPTSLSSGVRSMISRSLDWSHLLQDWDWDQNTHSIVSHVQDQVDTRPSLEGYTVTEVLESMLIQKMIKHEQSSDVEAVKKMATTFSLKRSTCFAPPSEHPPPCFREDYASATIGLPD